MARSYPFDETDGQELDPGYGELRRTEPVCRVRFPHGGDGWLATGYETARVVLTDRRFSRAAAVEQDVPRILPQRPPHNMTTMDPPEHTRLRRLLATAFARQHVDRLRTRIEAQARRLLHDLEPPADLVRGFTTPLAVASVCELTGIPVEDRQLAGDWIGRIMRTDLAQDSVFTAVRELRSYLTGLVAQRRHHHTGDVLGLLVTENTVTGELDEHELVMLGSMLLIAGIDTTANQLSGSIHALLTHPDQLAVVRADPRVLPAAVEELLRFVPLTIASFTRIAMEDVQVGDVTVRAGDAILVHLPSANRDEATFTDPDDLDVTRRGARHLAFGHGTHHCLGAQPARMALEVGLGTLLERFPRLALAGPVSFESGRATRGPATLVVRW